MKINSNTQSFTSLNKAIKVTKLDNTNSSSSKKLDDSVSLNISSNVTSNTASLLNSLKEETVIQSRNGYVNSDEAKRVKMLEDHYSKMYEENKTFAYPYAHVSDKYYSPSSPYYIQGLTDKEREAASSTEISYLNGGKLFSYDDTILKNEPPIFGDV